MRKRTFTLIGIAASLVIFAGCSQTPTANAVTPKSADKSISSTSDDDKPASSDPTTDASPKTSSVNASPTSNSSQQTASSSLKTEEEAKNTALTDAGIEESALDAILVKLDTDDGTTVYEVEFYSGGVEYDYTINAATLAIIEKDNEINDDFYTAPTTSGASITQEEASSMALAKVSGASQSNIRIELDYEDGTPVYEGEIIYNGYEYEFEINGNNGTFIKWEQDIAD